MSQIRKKKLYKKENKIILKIQFSGFLIIENQKSQKITIKRFKCPDKMIIMISLDESQKCIQNF
jgi:hypothetical protein